ncbi:SERTA domain-containing protein 3 [Marasmius crinis-equi]|uniref:SERTA domain-containing protein 3 n=1 Tax=Marasmius crinis-equi TaxID=585013 RepID=A0ABR3FXD6_9AGAR
MLKRTAEVELHREEVSLRVVATPERTTLQPYLTPRRESAFVRDYHRKYALLRRERDKLRQRVFEIVGKVDEFEKRMAGVQTDGASEGRIENRTSAHITFIQSADLQVHYCQKVRLIATPEIQPYQTPRYRWESAFISDYHRNIALIRGECDKLRGRVLQLTEKSKEAGPQKEKKFDRRMEAGVQTNFPHMLGTFNCSAPGSDSADMPSSHNEKANVAASQDLIPSKDEMDVDAIQTDFNHDAPCPHECLADDKEQPIEEKPGKVRKVTLLVRPPWLKSAMKCLGIEGEEEYNLFLEEYGVAETKHGVAEAPGNTFTHRPPCIIEWSKGDYIQAFDRRATPEITREFALHFPGQVWAWWFNIQPQGRVVRKGNTAVPPTGNRLQSLNKTLPPMRKKLWKWGMKGWVSLIVALRWWYLSIPLLESAEQEGMKAEWRLAVQEMRATLTVLISKDE